MRISQFCVNIHMSFSNVSLKARIVPTLAYRCGNHYVVCQRIVVVSLHSAKQHDYEQTKFLYVKNTLIAIEYKLVIVCMPIIDFLTTLTKENVLSQICI